MLKEQIFIFFFFCFVFSIVLYCIEFYFLKNEKHFDHDEMTVEENVVLFYFLLGRFIINLFHSKREKGKKTNKRQRVTK